MHSASDEATTVFQRDSRTFNSSSHSAKKRIFPVQLEPRCGFRLTGSRVDYCVKMPDGKLAAFLFSCRHSPCGTVGQRAGDPAGLAWAGPPASTGGASPARWSPSCPTRTRAPAPAAGSIPWTSRSTCRCLCSTCPTATAPPSTCLTSAVRTLP